MKRSIKSSPDGATFSKYRRTFKIYRQRSHENIKTHHVTTIYNCWQCDQQRKQAHRPFFQPLQALPDPHSNIDTNSRKEIPSSTPSASAPISSTSITESTDKSSSSDIGVRIALSLLRFYKTAISPLLQPACRFLPTCSSYAVDAYTEYGVGKGTILTAWRLMRCNPWGGSGFDPVQWPPPGLEWAFHGNNNSNNDAKE